MLIALNEKGERIHIDEAVRHGKYYCQTCGSNVDVKKGPQRMHHFSHSRKAERPNCDSWNHDKTDWHRSWQNLFPIECQEVVMKNKEGIRHIADVSTDGKVVEFQHSPMSIEEFNKRNEFYSSLGYPVIWLFDARSAEIDNLLNNHIILKKEIQAINGFDPTNENIMVFIQISGKEIASIEDSTSEIRRIIGKDEMGFKLDEAINIDDFTSVIKGDISYEILIENKKCNEMLSRGQSIRRLMGQSKAKYITAFNARSRVEARIENSDKILNSTDITGQLKTPGHDTFSRKIYSIYDQNDPVWVLT